MIEKDFFVTINCVKQGYDFDGMLALSRDFPYIEWMLRWNSGSMTPGTLLGSQHLSSVEVQDLGKLMCEQNMNCVVSLGGPSLSHFLRDPAHAIMTWKAKRYQLDFSDWEGRNVTMSDLTMNAVNWERLNVPISVVLPIQHHAWFQTRFAYRPDSSVGMTFPASTRVITSETGVKVTDVHSPLPGVACGWRNKTYTANGVCQSILDINNALPETSPFFWLEVSNVVEARDPATHSSIYKVDLKMVRTLMFKIEEVRQVIRNQEALLSRSAGKTETPALVPTTGYGS